MSRGKTLRESISATVGAVNAGREAAGDRKREDAAHTPPAYALNN